MTTETLANLANLDNVGSGLDLQVILRDLVFPEFFLDVGEASWRNAVDSVSLVAGDRQKDLPDDFWAMKSILIPPTGSTQVAKGEGELKYIGEDTAAMLAAEVNTTQRKPTGYWIAARAGTAGDPGVGSFRAVRFDAPSDAPYTATFVYERGPVFADAQTNVNLDTWMPSIAQGALVKLLRRRVMEDRFGQNDPRYVLANDEYSVILSNILDRGTQQARRNYARYAS